MLERFATGEEEKNGKRARERGRDAQCGEKGTCAVANAFEMIRERKGSMKTRREDDDCLIIAAYL